MKDEEDKKILNLIDTNLGDINIDDKINKKTNKIEEESGEKDLNNNIRKANSFNSDMTSIQSSKSGNTQRSLISQIFNEEKDLDLPNFTSTKYASIPWKISHFLLYFFHNSLLIASTSVWFLKELETFNILLMIAHFFYFIATFLQWLYYNRGCLTPANLNTNLKSNVDPSFKAKILRSETGWIYFFSFIAAIILLYGNLFFIIIDNKTILIEFWNINLVGTMLVSVTQILKIEKALVENRQYKIKNDLSRSIVEIFLFFGSLFFGCSYLIQIMYSYDSDKFFILLTVLKFIGNGFICFSGFTMCFRYFCSNIKDLNTSDMSYVTV